MSDQEGDGELEAHLLQFRLAAAPEAEQSLQRAHQTWHEFRPRGTWTWILPIAAAAMLMLDAGIMRWLAIPSSSIIHPVQQDAQPLSTGLPDVTPAAVRCDPAITLSMLEHHLDSEP